MPYLSILVIEYYVLNYRYLLLHQCCWTIQLPVSFIKPVLAELFNYRYLLLYQWLLNCFITGIFYCQCLDYFYLVFYFTLTSSKRIFFLLIHVFWHVESKSDVHFSLLEPKTPYNPGKIKFPTDGNGLKMEGG